MFKIKAFLVFILINFSALALGSLLMNDGPSSAWYMALDKAPWTPPGWMFGLAWTSIMICFSVYMTYLYTSSLKNQALKLFSIQFLLNVSWNALFFNLHLIELALLNIIALTLLIWYFFGHYFKLLKLKSIWVLPYGLWLLIASSLNLYISLNN